MPKKNESPPQMAQYMEPILLIPVSQPEVMLYAEDGKEIMGRNFLGPSVARKCFKLEPEQCPTNLGPIPFTFKALEKRAQTHILVAVPGVSILDIITAVE